MPIRPYLIAPLFAAAAFACMPPSSGAVLNSVARADCVVLPNTVSVGFTIVRGDVDAYLVSEFVHKNPAVCTKVIMDGVTRGVPDGRSASGSGVDDAYLGAVAVHWDYYEFEPESREDSACAKIRRTRVVSAIPRLYSPDKVFPPVVLPADSVFDCQYGSCQRTSRLVVDNKPNPDACLVGMPAPAPSREAALEYLRGRLEVSGSVYRLDKAVDLEDRIPPRDVYCPGPELIQGIDAIAKDMQVSDNFAVVMPELVETRIEIDDGLYRQWPLLDSWNDTAVPADLAIRSRGNAGDRFESEDIQFQVALLRGAPSNTPRSVSIRTGIKRYEYIGRQIPMPNTCGVRDTSATIVGDTLLLDGLSIRLTNDGCPRKGMDVFAGRHSGWLVAPSDNQALADAMRHGASIENGTSWPIDGDSVLVRGWNLPLEEALRLATSVGRKGGASGFSARAVGAALEVDCTKPGFVEIVSADGRKLLGQSVVAGRTTLRIPVGARGVLTVRSAEGTARVVVP